MTSGDNGCQIKNVTDEVSTTQAADWPLDVVFYFPRNYFPSR